MGKIKKPSFSLPFQLIAVSLGGEVKLFSCHSPIMWNIQKAPRRGRKSRRIARWMRYPLRSACDVHKLHVGELRSMELIKNTSSRCSAGHMRTLGFHSRLPSKRL